MSYATMPTSWAVRISCWLALCSLTAVPAFAQEPEVIVELGSLQIYEGESVQYRVTLNNVEDPRPPLLEGFDDFTVKSLGEQSLNSRQITIINGRRSEIVRYGMAYNFMLTPQRSGELTIPAPTAEVQGKTLRGQSQTLLVVAPQVQDDVVLRIEADKTSVYPMQPFDVTLTVSVKALPGRYADQNPVGVQRTPPALTIPWVDDDAFGDALVPEQSWQRWLGSIQNRRGDGFGINNIGSGSVFSLFEDSSAAFLPRAERTQRKDDDGQEVGYWDFKFARAYLPKQVGSYTFGPAVLKGTFVTKVDDAGRPVGEEIYTLAAPLAIAVKDVPEAGRPQNYLRAVGTFEIESKLVPTKAKVGDPMTLTFTLRGRGTLDTAIAPDLLAVDEVADNFKVYEATSDSAGGERRFTYSLRPLRDRVREFPAIAVSYFDVDREQYVTATTRPIPIEVSKAEKLSGREIETADPGSGQSTNIETRTEGIFANITGLDNLKNKRIRPVAWYASLAGMLGFYLAFLVVFRTVRHREGDVRGRRRRAAAARARARLQNALSELNADRPREGAEHLNAAFAGLVADIADIPETGLTSAEAQRHLSELKVAPELVTRFADLFAEADTARYGASSSTLHHLGDDARGLLDDLIADLQSKRLFR